MLTLENQTVGELLARKADDTPPPAQRALRRAARRAFLWGVEVAELARAGTSLTQVGGVGPYIEKLIREGLANPHRPFFRGLLRVLYSLFRLHRKYEQYRVASATA